MAAKSVTKPLVWILMGLLILALGGFGVTSLQGTLRSIGNVGEAEIRLDDYFRGLQNEINALQTGRQERVTFLQAQAEGVPERVMSRLITEAALDHEMIVNGVSIGDEPLSEQILSIPQFRGADGEFNREAYRFTLERLGQNEAEFENNMRQETARSFLQGAVASGVVLPDVFQDTMAEYLGQRRHVTWSLLDRNNLEIGLPEPTDAELESFHSNNPAPFTLPEAKRITYAWLTPEMILDTVEVDEQSLRDAYEAQAERFIQPDRRMVNRLIFPDAEAASAARAKLDDGTADFPTLVDERGLTLSDTDLGVVDADALGDVADEVFAGDSGDVLGPIETSLGPAFFRINAVLEAQEVPFEEATPLLRDAVAADRARRVVDAQTDPVDDLLAAGATIEDLAAETDMQLATIDWSPQTTQDIAAYEAFRAAAAELDESDFPEVLQLEDGSIYAMRLDEVVAPRLQPLEEVRADVEAAWRADQLTALLREQADPLAERMRRGESFEEVGLDVTGTQEVTRRGFIEEAPAEFLDTVFGMEDGEVRLIEGAGRLFVLKLDSTLPHDPEDEALQEVMTLIRNDAANGLSRDLLNILANDIRGRAGIELDEAAINAVHLNFQ